VITPFEVLVDLDDDVTVVREIHRLAQRDLGLCVATVPPDSHLSVAVRWAILRALGKRSEQLRAMPQWFDVTRWLSAHCVTELVLLRAQHLREGVLEELAEEVVGRLGVRVVLVYSGANHTAAPACPSVDLVTLATRARPSTPPQRHQRPWPSAPRVHPLRLRHDARTELSEREFQEVQQLLAAACSTMSTWLLHHAGARSFQIAAAMNSPRPDLTKITRSFAELELTSHFWPLESGFEAAPGLWPASPAISLSWTSRSYTRSPTRGRQRSISPDSSLGSPRTSSGSLPATRSATTRFSTAEFPKRRSRFCALWTVDSARS